MVRRTGRRSCRLWPGSGFVDPAYGRHPQGVAQPPAMINDGDQVPLSPRLHAQHAEPVLLVVVGHTLDQACRGFGGTGVRIR